MTSLPVSQARSRLNQLLDEAADSHEPILITGKRSNAVLISEDDWRSIQETIHLVSIPGMRESILEGMAQADGVSIDSFIATVLSQRVAVADADSYIRLRGNKGSAQLLLEILSQAPQIEPEAHDKL